MAAAFHIWLPMHRRVHFVLGAWVGGRGGACRVGDKRLDMQVCGTTCARQLTPTQWSARIPFLMPHCFIPTCNRCLHIITRSICTHLKPIVCVQSVIECHNVLCWNTCHDVQGNAAMLNYSGTASVSNFFKMGIARMGAWGGEG